MLASDFLFDECPDMSKKHASADCEYTEAGESSRVYDVGGIMPLSGYEQEAPTVRTTNIRRLENPAVSTM